MHFQRSRLGLFYSFLIQRPRLSFPSLFLFRWYFSTHLNVTSERCASLSLSLVYSNRRSQRQELYFPTRLRCIAHTRIPSSLFLFLLREENSIIARFRRLPNQSARRVRRALEGKYLFDVSCLCCACHRFFYGFRFPKYQEKLQSFTSSHVHLSF